MRKVLTQLRSSKPLAAAFVVVLACVAGLLTAIVITAVRTSTPSAGNSAASEQIGFTRLDKPAPAVSLPSLAGRGIVSVARLTGRPIVINFWSTTCEICKQETPAIVRVAAKMQGKVTFIGIDTADERGPAMAFVQRYHVSYPIGFDPTEIIGTRFGIPGLPATFFLSSNGKQILGENLGALTSAKLTAILMELYGLK
jgi:thiol-disulfide isomerase/thioredoxin